MCVAPLPSILTAAVETHGRALAVNLAGDAKEPLLTGDALSLDVLARHTGEENGLVAARLLDRDGVVIASVMPAERGETRRAWMAPEASEPHVERSGQTLEMLRLGQRRRR